MEDREKIGYGTVPTYIMKMDIPQRVKLLLMCLCCYAGDKDYSFPSITTICKDLGMGRTTVLNALKEAENFNLIKREKLYKDDPFKKNNKYVLMFKLRTIDSPVCGTSDSPSSEPSMFKDRTENINININKNIINNNINNSDSSESQKIETWKYIEKLFRDKQEYDNWPKQRKHSKELAERIKKVYESRGPDESIYDFSDRVISFFWNLKNKGSPFWKSQPFFPATLNSERIWNMFLEEIKKRKKPTEEDFLRGIKYDT